MVVMVQRQVGAEASGWEASGWEAMKKRKETHSILEQQISSILGMMRVATSLFVCLFVIICLSDGSQINHVNCLCDSILIV